MRLDFPIIVLKLLMQIGNSNAEVIRWDVVNAQSVNEIIVCKSIERFCWNAVPGFK